MKLEEIVDVAIQESKTQVVIELENGQRRATKDYYFDTDKSGKNIIVIRTGRYI